MKTNSLSSKGLSLSQAQSISNLCHQECRDIDAKLEILNNASRTLTLNGKEYIETQAHSINNEDVLNLLGHKGQLHATQAFLMENIRAKNEELDRLKNLTFTHDIQSPEYPELEDPNLLSEVDEDWGWDQLSSSEYNEFLEAEAFASHYGQFIHKGGKLDVLRRELPTLKTLEWMVVEDGKKTPLKVDIHHTIEQLGSLHTEIASLHRKYEQRVNYFKAKVKNLVTQENARIAKENANEQQRVNNINSRLVDIYETAREEYRAKVSVLSEEFELERQNEISKVAELRIKVDSRFKVVIDNFLKEIE